MIRNHLAKQPKAMQYELTEFRKEREKIKTSWASLVAQGLRICLLMQETRVRALVWGDPTCCGAARPVSYSY